MLLNSIVISLNLNLKFQICFLFQAWWNIPITKQLTFQMLADLFFNLKVEHASPFYYIYIMIYAFTLKTFPFIWTQASTSKYLVLSNKYVKNLRLANKFVLAGCY